ncbi:MAG: hypothetical protein JWP63_4323 [Candidatus Solibacter sp.]|nr:hypothetical protein [Candidatus Solibacter sp.]
MRLPIIPSLGAGSHPRRSALLGSLPCSERLWFAALEFGWRARTSFDDGLRNTVEYYVSSRRSLALV